MATDGPDPPACAAEVYKNGALVMITHSIPANALEAWVKTVAEQSGQAVDWHFAGGRACILALGDLERVRAAIEALLPEHDEMQRKEYEAVLPDMIFRPSRTLYGENEINTAHEALRQWNEEN